MTHDILIAVLILGALGVLFAVVLYIVAQKFKVVEDPRPAWPRETWRACAAPPAAMR